MKLVIDPNYQSYADFLRRLPQLFAEGEGEVVYQKRNEVRRFQLDGMSLMVKRYKKVNALQQVVYTFFRKTKACRAFLFAREFRKRAIETPEEVAYLETTNRLGLFTVGYFVSREVEGTESHLLLREVKEYDPLLADAVATQVVLMHSRGILHGDLNLSNFLCREENGEYRFSMIDVNRSHFTEGWPTDDQCIQNLVRITHRRDLYEYVIRAYARQRGWDEEKTFEKALKKLESFEHKGIIRFYI